MTSSDLLARFAEIVGDSHVIADEAGTAPHLNEPRRRWHGRTAAVLRPGTTDEVAQILRLASETGTPIVPQGGNTGLVGGQIPDMGGDAVIVSTSRLNRIRDIDTAGNTITVEAGVVLEAIRDAAADHGRLFPLSLASQGSCQIGGNLSTNAGGTGALAHGVARDLCLGLEVVLADGSVLDDLNRLKKNNTGYNLRDLFIGAEGTLGIVTAAVLRLFPQPAGIATAFVAVPSPDEALELLDKARAAAGSELTAFELMARIGIDFTLRHQEGTRDPLEHHHPWYVLIEISSARSQDDARQTLEALLMQALEHGVATDAVLAENERQRLDFWRLREGISDSQIPEGGSIKHDVSVPVAEVPRFMAEAARAVHAIEPAARICAFGHLGDGNIHYNISQPVGADKQTFLAATHVITPAVHAIVRQHGGSIAAEHGIGQMKRDELAETKNPVALDLMKRIKRTLDPAGIMNPGKVILPD
ncbi:FAD-binding oxidoreductase [Oricola sp.]|uniref:FAD-binding oxidoreductase n=1 Tax=Oricola sp. TaxID=1979950 RepID=UPI003BACC2A7